MGKGRYTLRLLPSMKSAAERLAKEDGVSLNQWIASAVAQKVGSVETAAEFLKRRAGNAGPDDLRAFLKKIPARDPVPGDEL